MPRPEKRRGGVPLEHVVAKRRDGRRPSSLERERENDDEWKIREAQPLIQLDRNPGFNQHTETHREMFCSKPSGFVRHNWLPPRDPIEKSNTRDFFFLFHGRWLRCELYRYHPSSSIENACSDWSASDPPRRAPYIDPRISPRRIQNGLCDRSNFDFIFRQLSPRNLADVILVEDSYVDWSFRKGGGICSIFLERYDMKNNLEAMISSSTKVTFIFLYVSIEKKSKSLMNYSFKFRTLKYSRLIFDERETQIRLTIRTNIFSFWYSITIGSTRSSTVLN